ncbi:MAG: glycoside hydrolase family 32 protein [Clostridiales bacterium]|nr:glycoside hydrolase family 32 protein [Clostridiales bacterium]
MRQKYHFEPQKGWINDPNGLIYFKGRYHAFFQHNPYAPVWDTMYWGHAVSDDLINWQELPIALYPDMPYENSGGCFSGSAVEKDGRLYIFYTSVSNELGQTQSLAVSDDAVTFVKYEGNPIIGSIGVKDFRDPKVTKLMGRYYMVCGSGSGGTGRVLLYVSDDLYFWEPLGTLIEGKRFGNVIECPDFFELDGKYVLSFSQMFTDKQRAIRTIVGSFDGMRFTPEAEYDLETGPDYYAPQSFLDHLGRRIVIGWMVNPRGHGQAGLDYAGAFSIPRQLFFEDGLLKGFPIAEAAPHLKGEDELVRLQGDRVTIGRESERLVTLNYLPGEGISILRDSRSIEVFIGNGRTSASLYV